MSSLAQKKLLKKQRKDARRQASNVIRTLESKWDGSNNGEASLIPPQAIRAMNIVNGNGQQKCKNLSPRVSKAFDNGEWDEATSLLFAMRHLGQVPKLGTLQRWVANLGDNTTMDPTALGLLYAILRVANGLGIDLAPESTNQDGFNKKHPPVSIDTFSMMNPIGSLNITKEWAPVPLSNIDTSSLDTSIVNYHDIFSVLTVIKGIDRTPPNRHDLVIYECIPNALGLETGSSATKVDKVNVPFVPDAFALTSLLSPLECSKIIKAAEAIGFVPDEPISRTTALVAATSAGLDDRAANFTWLVDDALMESIMVRCRHYFPPILKDGSQFVGMNARWRLYRYYPGSIYRPHVDGAWPQSGKILKANYVDSGCQYEYEYDISNGQVRSRLTFLIYLNEGFEGGHTTYFTPNMEREGEVLAHKVSPRTGMAILFPHGEGAGSLVHEGSNLVSGVKYVIRSDALYTVPSSQVARLSEENNRAKKIRI